MTKNKNQTLLSSNMTCTLTIYSCLLGLLLLVMVTPSEATVHSVFTYKNASTQLGQVVTSSTLVWETYDGPWQMQFAVEGGKYVTADEHYPIFVCRVNIDGMHTSGHTEKIQQKHVCKAEGKNNENFDVLMNKGHLGKIGWRQWTKFTAGVPVGAIRIGEDSYIGRHKDAAGEHHGADYNLGSLELTGLGKIRVMEQQEERNYDEGEVLIETEPVRYELRDIKLDRLRTLIRDNLTELATGQLENLGDTYNTMEKVMSYSFDQLQYWGSHEGVARGLPTKIYEKDASTPSEINWALKRGEKRPETKVVSAKLWPGTAINVTLLGNYVTLEAPYSAKLFAYYHGSESVSRKISAELRKSYLKDVKLEFSPVFWIENGTIVPTTTTTSTTSTSTTTHATTTSTNEPVPINEPPLVEIKHVGDKHSGPDTLEKTLQKSNEVNAHEAPENMSSKDAALAGFGLSPNNAAASLSVGGTIGTLLLTLLLL
ncbi:uzip [Drosophila busckii]|uniref:Uzip n=1 Tax=Drosophila busckii TaxID=30019 RepID=A0A0M4EF47_DROBS|nr:protein unzipped [Drosophila busckii]XP_017838575.1 protein unzipped [Drosophila busckii]ALC42815.1 uzip [Drosophila busckii]